MLYRCTSARSPACCSMSPTARPGASGPRSPPPSSPNIRPARRTRAAAAALAERDFEVAAATAGPLSAAALAGAEVLVIAHPSEARWERTVGGSPLLLRRRDRRHRGVRRRRRRPRRAGRDRRRQVRRQPERAAGALRARHRQRHSRRPRAPQRRADLGVRRTRPRGRRAGPAAPRRTVCFYRAGALHAEPDGALVLRTGDAAHPAGAGLLAAVRHGEGRVVVAADSDLFGDDALGEFDHLQLWLNLLYWVALPAFRAEPEPIVSAAAHDVAWERLRDETDALRLLQEPSGEVDLDASRPPPRCGGHVAAMTEAIGALGSYFPHQQAYLDPGGRRPARAGSTTAAASPTSPRRLRSFAPSRCAATASSTSSCSPCTRPTARPTRASRR